MNDACIDRLDAPAPQPDTLPDPDDPPADEAKAAAFRRQMNRAADMSVAEAAQLHIAAQRKHQVADRLAAQGDRIGSRFELAEAAESEAVATLALDPLSHSTGRVVAGAGEAVLSKSRFADTLRAPDMVGLDAAEARLALAEEADVVTLALDTAQTIGAANSAEKMLAEQLAGAHKLAMTMMGQAVRLTERFENSGHVALSIEAGRMANAATRLMDSFQHGLLTIGKLRGGGTTQTVVVKHLQQVAVGEGGQAVIAGQARGKRQRGRDSRGTSQ
jgi:hypothetical protein